MKKLLFIVITLVTALMITGCANSNEESETESKETENKTSSEAVEEEESEKKAITGEEETTPVSQQAKDVEDIQLQLSKVDEDAGVVLEDSQVYGMLNEAIAADPKLGAPNDVTFFPYRSVVDENGNRSLLFLIVNRLPDSITDMSLTMTYGNKDGAYLWENLNVNIPGDQIGVLKPNHAVPFSLQISEEQKEIFDTINMENADLRIADFQMEIVE